jgi:predicted RND superfamily exporter protein
MERKYGYGEWVIRFRWWIILATLLVVAVAASGARFLDFSSDYRVFFSKENPQMQAFDALQNTYTKNDNVMIALAPKNGQVFTRENLAAIEELTKQAWQIPYSIRVESVTNFQHSWADGDGLVVEDLVKNAMSLSDRYLEQKKKVALSEPLLINRLISTTAHVTGINVTINLPGKTITEVPEVASFVRNMADDFRANHSEFNVYLTGVAMINNQFVESGQQDMQTLVPIMFMLIAVGMWVALRSLAGTMSTLLLIGMATATALGIGGWWGVLLTPVSANAPVYILTMAVADSIHILITLFHEMRNGKAKNEAIIESLRVNFKPVLITSVTTAIGFLSLNFSDSPPYWDLGNMVAVGVLAAFAYSVLFLPALMSVIPLAEKTSQPKKNGTMDRVADFVIHNRKRLYWGMMAVIIALTVFIPRIQINDLFEEYFDHRYTFRTDTDFVTQNLTGFESIEYSLNAGEAEGISKPEYLAKLEEFKAWYRQQPNVMYVGALTDVMKRLNKNMHGDDQLYYEIPKERELAAQYLLLFEMSLPYGLDLNNQINVSKSATRFTVVFKEINTKTALALEEKAQVWLKENGLPGMQTHGASPLIMFSNIALRNVESMLVGTALALVLISGILMVTLRSFKFGLISLIPNLVPAFMAFGLWALVFEEIGMAVSVVIALSLGVIVDDTVHFLSKYLLARREQGKTPEEAVRYSFHTVGMALWVTSIVLVTGFLVLATSGFTINSHMGYLTAMTIGFALLADFLFLPPLLMKIEEKSGKGVEVPVKMNPAPSTAQ